MVARQDAEPFRTRKVPFCYAIKDVGNDKPFRVFPKRLRFCKLSPYLRTLIC